jgi:hypothetical protein
MNNVKYPGHFSRYNHNSNVGRGKSKPDQKDHYKIHTKVNEEARKHIECNGRYQERRERLQKKIEERNNSSIESSLVATAQTVLFIYNTLE